MITIRISEHSLSNIMSCIKNTVLFLLLLLSFWSVIITVVTTIFTINFTSFVTHYCYFFSIVVILFFYGSCRWHFFFFFSVIQLTFICRLIADYLGISKWTVLFAKHRLCCHTQWWCQLEQSFTVSSVSFFFFFFCFIRLFGW